MTAGLWMRPALVAGTLVLLWGAALLDCLLAPPAVLRVPLRSRWQTQAHPARPISSSTSSVNRPPEPLGSKTRLGQGRRSQPCTSDSERFW